MDPVWVIEEMLEHEPGSDEAFRTWWESRWFWERWTEEDWHEALRESGRVYRELIATIEAAWGPPDHRNPSGDEIGDAEIDITEEDLETWPPNSATYWVRGERKVCVWEDKEAVESPFVVNIAIVWNE